MTGHARQLEWAMALVRPAHPDQFGGPTLTSRRLLLETLAGCVAQHFEVERLRMTPGLEYEAEIALSDLDDLWQTLADQYVDHVTWASVVFEGSLVWQ